MRSRIEVNPEICHGKPVIRGTRILVRNVFGSLAGGDSIEDILQNYPELTREDIKAAGLVLTSAGFHPTISIIAWIPGLRKLRPE